MRHLHTLYRRGKSKFPTLFSYILQELKTPLDKSGGDRIWAVTKTKENKRSPERFRKIQSSLLREEDQASYSLSYILQELKTPPSKSGGGRVWAVTKKKKISARLKGFGKFSLHFCEPNRIRKHFGH
ncbi:hypothetical protein CEXT_193321 [Caerostris extrusa]|uniref:Uncharacterized protein n=1 Tax=Caerostris extrusa TaxID=172846 RepID=A0AAV4S4B1_CAEEX|nr:hypothetical protein CEXT_193321 [Caerostris extrusa]